VAVRVIGGAVLEILGCDLMIFPLDVCGKLGLTS
jgi:hypothetical protein